MVWKFMTSNGSFEGRSMVLNTTYQICLQNVETDYLDVFAKCWKPICFLVKYMSKDERALTTDFLWKS